MEARLLWEQETAFICGSLGDGRFDSEVSDFLKRQHGSRGLVAQIRLIRGSR